MPVKAAEKINKGNIETFQTAMRTALSYYVGTTCYKISTRSNETKNLVLTELRRVRHRYRDTLKTGSILRHSLLKHEPHIG